MVNQVRKSECTGCSACFNGCPTKAIKMVPDCMGFCYPVIGDECIGCYKCNIICNARINRTNLNLATPRTYAAWSKNSEIRYTSTSGGAFSEIAAVVLDKGGYVIGAQYGKHNSVEHAVVSKANDLLKIRQSKYVQSNIGDSFTHIRNLLVEHKHVLFCGTPCQVAGLYAFLGKDFDNLVTIDFICRGVNSPKAFQAWISEIEAKNRKQVKNIWFKYKADGWKKSPRCTKVTFEDGIEIIYSQEKNLYMEGYLTYNLYMRPSCGECKFKGTPRQADITLADFWKVDRELDDDCGTSMVLLNNEKGPKLFEKVAPRLNIHKKSFEDIYQGNLYFDKSVVLYQDSERFFKLLDSKPFSEALKIVTHRPFLERINIKMKKYQTRLYRFLKHFVRKNC